jgi:hypothetical protein
MENNVIKFKRRKFPKKKLEQMVMVDFEQMISDVRKSKIKAFIALIWSGDDVFPYESYNHPVDLHTILGAIEAYKMQRFKEIVDGCE